MNRSSVEFKRFQNMLSKLKKFSHEKLGLKIHEEFTEITDSLFFWVYASKKDSLESVIESETDKPFKFFDEDQQSAEEFEEQLRNNGYDTYLFYTDNNSDNNKLLESFLTADITSQVSDMMHESTHRFFKANEDYLPTIPYDIDEALATYMGTYGAQKFIQSHFPEKNMLIEKEVKYFLHLSSTINKYYRILNRNYRGRLGQREEIFRRFKKELRLDNDEEVNNAYFIRQIDYYKVFPVVDLYFQDGRRTMKGLFGAGKKLLKNNFEILLDMRKEYLENNPL